MYPSASVTQSPTSDASSTPETGGNKNADVKGFDGRVKSSEAEVERAAHPLDALDKMTKSPEELRYHLHTNSSRMTIISLLAIPIRFLPLFGSDLSVSKLE